MFWVEFSEACEVLGVSPARLRSLSRNQQVTSRRPAEGKVQYLLDAQAFEAVLPKLAADKGHDL